MGVADILTLRRQADVPSPRVTLTANGRVFTTWTAMSLERDIADIAAGATLEFYDPERARRAFPGSVYTQPFWQPLAPGARVVLAIDGEDVLRGWVEEFKGRLSGEEMACSISILDDAAHLAECAAAPTGPAEYRNLTLTQFATRICQPYGMGVRADVDVGAAFPLIGLDVADTALAAVEKLARQRALLVCSDGLGNLVLTRGGATPAAGALRLGENLQEIDFSDSWRGRFSDYYVKGQSVAARGARLDSHANPISTAPVTPPPAVVERKAVVMTGHATDPEVTLHRPMVRQAKTQSGGATVQQQAEWMARVARGKGQTHVLTVNDFRAGPNQALWRPNTLALLDDRFNDVLEERLITAVTYTYDESGSGCELKVTRRGAFDLIAEGDQRRSRRNRATGRAQDSTAHPLVRTP